MAGILVMTRHDHACEPLLNDPLGARWRPAMCATRFQGDVEGGASGRHGTGVEGNNLRMRLAGAGVKAFADDLPVFDNNSTDRRIGPCTAEGILRKAQCPSHECSILFHCLCENDPGCR